MSMFGIKVVWRLFLKASLLKRKRALLTIAAIAWGTVAILMLLCFGEGLKRQLGKNKRGMGVNLAVVWPGETSKVWQGLPQGRRIRCRRDDIPYLRRKLPEVEALVGEMATWSASLTYGQTTVTGKVVGTNAEFGEMRHHFPRPGGRFFNPRDEAEKKRVIFLGDALAASIFGAADPVGRTMFVNGSPYLVIGVMQTKQQMGMYGGPDANQAVIPITTFAAQFGDRSLQVIVFKVSKPEAMAGALERFKEAMSDRHRFDPTDNQALGIWDTVAMAQVMENFTLGLQSFLGIVGGLTLLVGGIGVANIMYAVVKESTRDIGVQMALGAKRSWITGPYMLQGLLYTLVGGALGTLMAVIVVTLLTLMPTEGNEALQFLGTPTLSWPIAAVTAAVLGSIGLIAGYIPARRASGIDPAATLRYE